jgi:hypothetical protein
MEGMEERSSAPRQIHVLAALMVVVGVITIWLGWLAIRAADADIDRLSTSIPCTSTFRRIRLLASAF